MHKSYLIILLLFFSAVSAKSFAIFTCSNGGHHGSIYELRSSGETYRFGVLHLGGVNSIPLAAPGGVTIGALEWFKTQAEVFKDIGISYSISFDKNDCIFSNKSVECSKNKKFMLGNVPIKRLFIGFSQLNESKGSKLDISWQISGDARYFNPVEGDGSEHVTHAISMVIPFDTSSCHGSLIKK